MRQIVSTSKMKKRAASSRAKPFEITAVFVPQDVADNFVNGIYMSHAGSSEANLGLRTSSDNNASTNALARSSLRSEDSEGKIISAKINELENKLTEASSISELQLLREILIKRCLLRFHQHSEGREARACKHIYQHAG